VLQGYREAVLVLIDLLDQVSLKLTGGRQGTTHQATFQRILQMSADEIATLRKALPEPQALAQLLRSTILAPAPRPPWKRLPARPPRARRGGAMEIRGVPGTNTPPFPPAYPTGSVYETFVATLDDLGHISDTNGDGQLNDERCTANSEAGLMIGIATAKILQIALDTACNTIVVILGEGTNAPACIASGLAAEALAGIEIALSQCQLQDALVDSAEIEAAFENSVTILDAVTCRQAATPRRGQACNGADDDCDQSIDECDEDDFGPDIHIDAAVSEPWYGSVAEAQAAVARAVNAVDDCQTTTVGQPTLAGTCDNVTATVLATDACGNQSTATTLVRIDGSSPTVAIQPSITNACFTSIDAAEQAVIGAATIQDDCASLAELEVQIHSSVTECALRVRLDVSDQAGNQASAAATVRVDTELPVVEIQRLLLGFRGEVLGFQTPACYRTVQEARAAVLAATRFSDNCTAREALATSVSSQGNACSLQVAAKAVDECGLMNTDTVGVRVDADPPEVSCSVEEDLLHPGNHEMVDVGFTYSASDNCNDPPEVVITVTSDERTAEASGAGGATHAPDAHILRDPGGTVQGVLLRAERSTAGDGRVYQIHVQATDRCGNTNSTSCSVSVRANPNQPAVDSGQFYDATAVN
jgi:hypothetical protein